MYCNNCSKLCSTCLSGGKIKLHSVTKFLKNSYKDNQENNIDGYKRDDELSGKRVQVYHNNNTGETNIIHRGTKGSKDWLNNLAYATGLYSYTDRYKHA